MVYYTFWASGLKFRLGNSREKSGRASSWDDEQYSNLIGGAREEVW